MKTTIIEVVEHEAIFVNADQGIDQESFDQLEGLILNLNEAEADTDQVIDFLTLSTKRDVGKVIRAKNYVGVLKATDHLQLEILPKIHGVDKQKTKLILLEMLKTLLDFPSKTFNSADLATEEMPLFEIFICLYIKEVHQLVRRGLQSDYYDEEDNVTVYKGKMNFSKHIRHNLVHKERFYVEFDEFGINRVENRLIKKALLYLNVMTKSEVNRIAIKQILHHFDPVDESKVTESDMRRLQISRNMAHYENSITWAKIFLSKQSFTSFAGAQSMVSMLFPMEKLFESYVGNTLRQLLHQSDWNVALQDRRYHLFKDKFALRPDIVLRNKAQNRTVVIDTKWKKLSASKHNYGISQSDMYQMYAYAKKYGSKEIFLMYPFHDFLAVDQETICFNSDDGINVSIAFVKCECIVDSLNEFIQKYLK